MDSEKWSGPAVRSVGRKFCKGPCSRKKMRTPLRQASTSLGWCLTSIDYINNVGSHAP